ncbi:MutS-related protein [Sphingobacterium faecale]|uniref:DNA mismatch repair proteins mutS family domain-containing protein n=1 Tax=Sphingobacterium faecale TaxID=2803775 RepID=A0ABS1QY51_9SPHI|nr:hypothetical protein [Sphingobacterium faecale]MBL1407352.1 hypothetical protein [Sphingobacterium faecale]
MKKFHTDNQTLEDLNVFGKFKKGSLFQLYNRTQTTRGEKLLERWLKEPFTEIAPIRDRQALIKELAAYPHDFPINLENLKKADIYLRQPIATNYVSSLGNLSLKKLKQLIGIDSEWEIFSSSLKATLSILKDLHTFITELNKQENKDTYRQAYQRIEYISKQLDSAEIKALFSLDMADSIKDISSIHYTLSKMSNDGLKPVIELIDELDVVFGIREVMKERKLCFADFTVDYKSLYKVEKLRHPALKDAVSNNLTLSDDSTVLFLTGANMAGKSTFMKAVASSLYLSHVGLPIAAHSLTLTLKEGLFTSINVPDNLSKGYSHFYAEVKRVKMIAEEVAAQKKLLVIFDELFKGTNVKDALEATTAVSSAFASHNSSNFIISTHIIEAADILRVQHPNMQFKFLPTVMKDNRPTYTYTIEEGVSSDKHGLLILKNEGVFELIEK